MEPQHQDLLTDEDHESFLIESIKTNNFNRMIEDQKTSINNFKLNQDEKSNLPSIDNAYSIYRQFSIGYLKRAFLRDGLRRRST